MKTRQGLFGRACLLVGLLALYLLAGMKVYLAWRDGMWPDWPLGDHVPDALVHWVFSLGAAPVRAALVWLLSRDVVEWAAAACLVLWLLTLFGNASVRSADQREDTF
jgi:hypothetical protein